ncbi:MAG: Gx transporter family protein [Treponemataceae bacterium]
MILAKKTINTQTVCMLGALCFLFSAIEFIIPKPLPFFRLGLANLPLLIGLELLCLPEFFLLVLIKIIGQNLLSGTIFSYVFLLSAGGTLASAMVMLCLIELKKKKLISFIGVSVMGAFVSNMLQILLATQFLGSSAWLIAPVFIILGLVTSIFLGLFANIFSKHSVWIKKLQTKTVYHHNIEKKDSITAKKSSFIHFFVGLPILLALFFSNSLLTKGSLMILIMALNYASKKKINLFFAFLMITTIAIFNIVSPAGKVLFSIGNFPVTEFALTTGLKKAFTIEGMIFLSKWMIHPQLTLPTKVGKLICQSFIIFEQLLSAFNKKKEKIVLSQRIKSFNLQSLIKKIDNILLEIERDQAEL